MPVIRAPDCDTKAIRPGSAPLCATLAFSPSAGESSPALLPDALLYDAMLCACVPSKDHEMTKAIWRDMAGDVC
jgi:hypothetical protein